jgi:serine/threonine protein kinase
MIKDDLEQDTRLLGTRGYAPPEQFGFAQTDARTDIYALGMTIEQLLGEKAKKPRYKRIIKKCTDLNPAKRYQSVKPVIKGLSFPYRRVTAVALLMILACALSLWVWRDWLVALILIKTRLASHSHSFSEIF